MAKSTIELADDGTMDTVLRCSGCGEEFRFNPEFDDIARDDTGRYIVGNDRYQTEEQAAEAMRDAYIEDIITETEDEHVCMVEHYDGDSGKLLLTMTQECAADCSTPGQPADDAVAHWVLRVEWHATEDELRHSLKSAGAWEDLDTADISVIKGRVLWMAACDWREENR